MDIKITESSLRNFLSTKASSEEIAKNISLCGPTFDRVHDIENDHLYEIEAITNRIDTASAQGVAREAVAILSQFGITSEMIGDPYKEKVDLYEHLPTPFTIHFSNPSPVIRYAAVTLENVSIKDSPEATKFLLQQCGQRPINNAVDITNELTILYGMPSHILDLDKLAIQNLTIRLSVKGERISTLDNKNNLLDGGDIVLEDGSSRLVDLCGVMGGNVAEVDDHTKNILLLVPVYDPKRVRKTSLRLQKRTLAAQIYEKQPDPELCLPVLTVAIRLFKERAGAHVSSKVIDPIQPSFPPKRIKVDIQWLNKFIGISLDKDKIITILSDLGFGGTSVSQDEITCIVPSWRYHDISIKEDIAEEVARVYGYFRLPSILPKVDTPVEPTDQVLSSEIDTKKYLVNIGFSEIFNNSLISKDLINQTEQIPSDFLKLSNSLSSDYEYLRINIAPSLLENLKNNQAKTEDEINIFELSNVYIKNAENELPTEKQELSLLSTKEYLNVKGNVESLFEKISVDEFMFEPMTHDHPYFLPSESASIMSHGKTLGIIGRIKPQVLRHIGISSNPTVCEIDFSLLVSFTRKTSGYTPISQYPEILEDITIQSNQPLGSIISTITGSDPLVKSIKYKGSYSNKHTFLVSFGSSERNLEQSEVNALKEKLNSLLK